MSTFTLAPTAPSHPRWRAALAAALVAVPLAGHLPQAAAQAGPKPAAARNAHNDPDFYVGLWVTRDGHVRHRLLPGGRYDEARGQRESAYRGRYTLRGDHIDYVDDTGFTADGEFRDGVLYHGGWCCTASRAVEAAQVTALDWPAPDSARAAACCAC